jgi:hypothetical protein
MNNVTTSVMSRVDADALKDVLLYANALLRHVHVQGVHVTRRCDGSNKLLIQIAVTDAVYDIYKSNKTGGMRIRTKFGSTYACLNSSMSSRERLWAVLSDSEDRFITAFKDNWQEANWDVDYTVFADGYKDHIDLNLVPMSTSSNFIQKRAVTFQPPLSEVGIWQLFDN